MRRLIAVLTLCLLPSLAYAQGYAQASAQAGLGYATPQAALAPAYGTCGVGAALAAPVGCSYGAAALAAPVVQSYAVPQLRIVQRQIIPQAVYVQPQAAIVQQYAPAVVQQQAIVSPYVAQSQALAGVGYGGIGVANNVGAGLIAGRQRAQKTVSRSRAVTVTRRPGLVNRVLGR